MAKTKRYTQPDKMTGKSLEELEKYRRKIAKVANQRLVELEKRGYYTGAHESVAWLAQRDKKRFLERIRKPEFYDRDSLMSELNVITNFLNTPSTTIRGRKAVIKKLSKSFAEKGIELSDGAMSVLVDHFDRLKDNKGRYDINFGNILAVTNKKTTADEMRELIRYVESETVTTQREADKRVKGYIDEKYQAFVKSNAGKYSTAKRGTMQSQMEREFNKRTGFNLHTRQRLAQMKRKIPPKE